MNAARVPAGVRAGGQFATRRAEEPGVRLTRRRDIDDYFDGGVNDYPDVPWVQAGTHITLWEGDWAQLPVEPVPLAGMRRTQRRVLAKHVARHLTGSEPEGGDLPWVVIYEGNRWVLDGHHRVVAALDRGETDIEAHLLDLDGRPHI
ncbi:hypothetical protein [Pseudactinotalea terrae]|uniref:hypothetical protein n=1 Tax=Pseudactinotalea terrae TaxID=1743262 RepID=UPI0012E20A23|nr:hypothetical protein [Pseudactinotalea terrae]